MDKPGFSIKEIIFVVLYLPKVDAEADALEEQSDI